MLATWAIIAGAGFAAGVVAAGILNYIAYRKWRKTHG
jgi:hypothetical protein